MPSDERLRVGHDGEAGEEDHPSSSPALRLHERLVRNCTECGSHWSRLGPQRDRVRERLRDAAEEPAHHLPGFLEDARRERRELSELRALHRKIRKEAGELVRMTPEQRREAVEKARSRFRSPLLAEQLIERVQERVRNDPRDAEDLAALVPRVLHWAREDADPAWTARLRHRAAAWRANALRVAGDLPAAERTFAALRRSLASNPVDDPRLAAETANLEAALRINQGCFGEAERLIECAHGAYRLLGDRTGVGRSLLQKGLMLRVADRPMEALEALHRAVEVLDGESWDDHLRFCAVSNTLSLLCDLGEMEQAERLLEVHREVFEGDGDPQRTAYLRALRGHIALGLGHHEEAAAGFQSAIDGLLELERHYDALLATLDMAHVYLQAGRLADLKPVARDLVAAFRARGVARESLAAVRLFHRAVAEEDLSVELLARLRQRLGNEHGPTAAPPL